MIVATAAVLIVAVLIYTLSVRAKDLPPPETVSPTKHLEERKATIYENLRDLAFEYRVGKLSDADYQATKADLQKELAAVLAEIDRLAPAKPAPKPAPKPSGNDCPHCGAKLPKMMKFCGECGKPLVAEVRR